MRHFKTILFILSLCFIHEVKSQIELISFDSSECLNEEIYQRKYNNRILRSAINEDYHLYEIFVVTNCSWASYGKIELKNDILNLGYSGFPVLKDSVQKFIDVTTEIHGSDTLTTETVTQIEYEFVSETSDCDCAFNLKYKIKGLENRDYLVTANNELITETKHKYKILHKSPKFDLIENDTINLRDIYGLKQGIHIQKIHGKVRSKFIFVDGKRMSGYNRLYNFKEVNTTNTSELFDKVETYMLNGKFSTRKYFKKEKLVKECDTDGTYDKGTNCRFFN